MKYKIAIIEEIHKDGVELLDKHPNFEYELISDVSEKNIIEKLPNFDACTLRVSKLDEKILKHCPKLKAISRHGVGYDNVDLNYIKNNKISLLITATANAVAVAEHVLSMFLSLSKSIIRYDEEVRTGNFKKNANKITTFELLNKNILIAGFGRIGKKLISRCLAFGTKVYVYDPYIDEQIIKEHGGIKVSSIEEGLKIADYVSLHIPLTNETKNLLNYNVFKKMKKNSILVNTARGGIINEYDLDKALNEGLIFGAGLDVFSNEPVENNNPLLKNKNIILSPHSATFTDECTSRMSIETTKNIIDFFENTLDKSMIVKL
ncbi:NAD(P)-binding domain-containing protein [Candidatus Pelagibacter bacterium]|nr:NAD(P)-binding domain-containing protein [Candidatus Pelagibacter bacterium]